MAMSIYRTLCVLVQLRSLLLLFLKISLLEMLIAVGNEHLKNAFCENNLTGRLRNPCGSGGSFQCSSRLELDLQSCQRELDDGPNHIDIIHSLLV